MIRRLTGEVKRKGPAMSGAGPSLTHNHTSLRETPGGGTLTLGIYTERLSFRKGFLLPDALSSANVCLLLNNNDGSLR